MDENETGQDPPLPPGYVSLAQLQERWIRKQQEEILKLQRAEEKKGMSSGTTDPNQNLKESSVSGDEKMKGKLPQDAAHRRRVGKWIEIEKSGGKKKNKSNKVEISKALIGEVHEAVLPKNGVKEEIANVKGKGYRGGRRKSNRYYRQGLKVNNVELESEEKSKDGILDVCEALGGLIVVDEHEFLGNNTTKSDKIDDPTIEESNNKIVLEKVGDEPLVIGKPKNSENWGVRTGFGRYRSKRRSKNEDNRAEEESSSNNKIALEKEVEEEPLVMEREERTVFRGYRSERREKCLGKKVEEESLDLVVMEKPQNGENGGGRIEFRRHWNDRGNHGRFRGIDWKGNVASRVRLNGGGNGRYGRFEDSWGRRHDGRKVWIKKGEKLDADNIGSSEISADSRP